MTEQDRRRDVKTDAEEWLAGAKYSSAATMATALENGYRRVVPALLAHVKELENHSREVAELNQPNLEQIATLSLCVQELEREIANMVESYTASAQGLQGKLSAAEREVAELHKRPARQL